MQKYELTVVFDGKITPAKRKKVAETIEKIIEVSKGKQGVLVDWGVKDLAYNLGNSSTGLYLHYPLELEESTVGGISAKLNQENDVLRFLLVRREKSASA